MAAKLTRAAPISITEIKTRYTIEANKMTTMSFDFADPQVLANSKAPLADETAAPGGLKVKVLSNSIPSVVLLNEITDDDLGYATLRLTFDGLVAQMLLEKEIEKTTVLEGEVVVAVTDLSPEGKTSPFTIKYEYRASKSEKNSTTAETESDIESMVALMGEFFKQKLEIVQEQRPESRDSKPP